MKVVCTLATIYLDAGVNHPQHFRVVLTTFLSVISISPMGKRGPQPGAAAKAAAAAKKAKAAAGAPKAQGGTTKRTPTSAFDPLPPVRCMAICKSLRKTRHWSIRSLLHLTLSRSPTVRYALCKCVSGAVVCVLLHHPTRHADCGDVCSLTSHYRVPASWAATLSS